MRKLAKYASVPRPTQRPMAPASGAALVSVSDRALVARGGRIFLTAVERAQIDRLEARLVVDAVGEPDERPRVRQTLSVETAEKVEFYRTVLEVGGDEHEGRHVATDAGPLLVGRLGEFNLERLAVFVFRWIRSDFVQVAPSGTSCRA